MIFYMPKSHNSIIFLGLLSAFSLLTFDLYQPSLPFITNYFNITPSMGQLTLSIYLLVYGITHLLWGPLIDHFGRRRLLPGNLLLALIGSLMCAFAPNITMLICGRALQGFALCCANLIAYSAARDFEDTIVRAKVLSYISMTVSVSPIIAPVIGALIFHHFGWQANFIVMAIVACILLIQTKLSLLESPFWTPPQERFSVKKILREYKSILNIPSLWCASFILMFGISAVMLTVINSSYLIIEVLNYSPLAYGLIFILNGLNIIFGNYLGIWLRDRLPIITTIYLGNWFIVLGGTAMLVTSKLFGFSLLALSFSLIANLGISVSAAPTISIALTDFKQNAGIVMAFMNTIRLIGPSLLTILTGYLLTRNLDALPLGLIGSGIGALFFSWHFSRLTTESRSSDMDSKEAVT